ncbi:MAG: YbhB/YbcL family Raf kinase inhibitor-like protein, partial [Croceibacterium sp.]
RQLNTGAAQSDRSGLKQTSNDFGESGYGPPCPPKGDKPHHYRFRLIALDVAELPVAPSAVRDIKGKSGGHVLGSAELTGLYGRD